MYGSAQPVTAGDNRETPCTALGLLHSDCCLQHHAGDTCSSLSSQAKPRVLVLRGPQIMKTLRILLCKDMSLWSLAAMHTASIGQQVAWTH